MIVVAGCVLALPAGAQISDPVQQKRLLMDAARAGHGVIAVGEWGAVLSTVDGRRWQQVRTPTDETLTAVQFIDARHGFAVGHHGTVIASSDGGASWTLRTPDPSSVEPYLGLHFLDARHGFLVGSFGKLHETRDGAVSVVQRDIGQGDRHLKGIGGAGALLVIASEEGTVYCSTDRGRSFRASGTGYRGSFWGAAVVDGAALVYGMRGNVYRSDDGCVSWSRVETGTEAGLTASATPGRATVLLAGAEGVMLESHDGGRSFRQVPRSDRSTLTAVVPLASGELLLLGRGAPLIHANGGAR